MLRMLLVLILGLLQGFLEWVPVSSSGVILLLARLFELPDPYGLSLYLHLGSGIAVLVKFREEYLRAMKIYPKPSREFRMIFYATATTIPTGILFYFVSINIEQLPTALISLIVGGLLLAVALLLFLALARSRSVKEPQTKDMAYLGLCQGLAALPGISRSGITVACLLFRNIEAEEAVKWSFIAALPAILGSAVLNVLARGIGSLCLEALVANIASFIAGLLSMEFMMKLAKRLGYAKFTFAVASILILSAILACVFAANY